MEQVAGAVELPLHVLWSDPRRVCAEAGGFLDLVALTRGFELRSSLALASEQDPGVDRQGLRDALGSFDRFTSTDFGVTDSEYEHVRAAVAIWRVDLAREKLREAPEIGV